MMYSETECKDSMSEAIKKYEDYFLLAIKKQNKEAHRSNIRFFTKKKDSHVVNGIKKQLKNFNKKKLQTTKKDGILEDIEDIELLEEYVYPAFYTINLIKMKRAYGCFNVDDSTLKEIVNKIIKNIKKFQKAKKDKVSKNLNITDEEIIEKYTYALFEDIDLLKIKKDYASLDIDDFSLKDIMSQLIMKIQKLERKGKSKILTNLDISDIVLLEKYAYPLFSNVDIYKMKQDKKSFGAKNLNLATIMYQLIIQINDYRFNFKQYHIEIMHFMQIHKKTNMRFIQPSPRNKKRISAKTKPHPIRPKKPSIAQIQDFLIGKDKYIDYNTSNYNYLKGKTNEIKAFMNEIKTNEEITGFNLTTYSTYLKKQKENISNNK